MRKAPEEEVWRSLGLEWEPGLNSSKTQETRAGKDSPLSTSWEERDGGLRDSGILENLALPGWPFGGRHRAQWVWRTVSLFLSHPGQVLRSLISSILGVVREKA